jgi:hypothetical protein
MAGRTQAFGYVEAYAASLCAGGPGWHLDEASTLLAIAAVFRILDQHVCSYWLGWLDNPLSMVADSQPSSIEDHVKRESPAALLEMHRALGLWLNWHYVWPGAGPRHATKNGPFRTRSVLVQKEWKA